MCLFLIVFYRENPDIKIQTCKSFKVYVVNNLTNGDVEYDGDFTFHKGDRKSQNDILLANRNGLISIDSFEIRNDIN